MKKLMLSLLWFISFQVLAGDVTPENRFKAGTDLLGQGKFDQAIAVLEKLEKDGINEPGLYNNLGFAYMNTEQKGKAVAYFEKALSLAPLDPQIIHNNRLTVVSEMQSETGFEAFIQDNYLVLLRAGDLVSQSAVILFFTSSLIFLLVAFKKGKISRNRWMQVNKNIIIIAAVLFLISYTFIFYLLRNSDAIMLTHAAGKIGPSADANSIIDLAEGEKLKIKNQFNGWYKVEKLNGSEAWVDGSDLVFLNE